MPHPCILSFAVTYLRENSLRLYAAEYMYYFAYVYIDMYIQMVHIRDVELCNQRRTNEINDQRWSILACAYNRALAVVRLRKFHDLPAFTHRPFPICRYRSFYNLYHQWS